MEIKRDTDLEQLRGVHCAAELLESGGDKESAEALRELVASALVLRNYEVMRGNEEVYFIINDLITYAKIAAIFARTLDDHRRENQRREGDR